MPRLPRRTDDDELIRHAARDLYPVVEIPVRAAIQRTHIDGVYVEALVWVPTAAIEIARTKTRRPT